MAKCKKCKGTGIYPPFKMDSRKECPDCEGTGVPLITTIEEQFNDASEYEGTKLHNGETGFIEFEEDDYKI